MHPFQKLFFPEIITGIINNNHYYCKIREYAILKLNAILRFKVISDWQDNIRNLGGYELAYA